MAECALYWDAAGACEWTDRREWRGGNECLGGHISLWQGAGHVQAAASECRSAQALGRGPGAADRAHAGPVAWLQAPHSARQGTTGQVSCSHQLVH